MTQSERKLRTNKMDVLERLYCDICNGFPRFQLKLKLEQDEYKLGTDKLKRSSHERYIKEAYDMCKIGKQEELDELRDIQYNRLLGVFNDAVESHDRMSAVAAIREMNKIYGVEAPVKKEVKAEVEQIITLDFGFDYDEDKDEPEAD